MSPDHFRLYVALLLAVATALAVNRRSPDGPPGLHVTWRWAAATVLLVIVLLVAVFVPVMTVDLPQDVDLASLDRWQLLASPTLLLGAAVAWIALAWGGTAIPRVGHAGDWMAALGLRAASPRRELAVGVVAGIGAWAAVLFFMLMLGVVLMITGGGEMPGGGDPSPLIVWLAGLPIAWRLALSLAAGVCEELFFRGLLQQRIGIAASTAIFVLGHVSYGAPLMLVGLTLLSSIYALLVRWRGSIWSAVVAHTIFDAIQLLVVIPAALAALEIAQPGAPAEAASVLSFCYASN